MEWEMFQNLKMKIERIFNKNGLGCSFLFFFYFRKEYFTKMMAKILQGLSNCCAGKVGRKRITVQGHEESVKGTEGGKVLPKSRPLPEPDVCIM